jgi:hypothetical protein
MAILKLDYGALKDPVDKGVEYSKNLNNYIEPGRFIISTDHTNKPDNKENIRGILIVTIERVSSNTYILQEYNSDSLNTDSQHVYRRTSNNSLGTSWTGWVQEINSKGGHVDNLLNLTEINVSGNATITGTSTLNGPTTINNSLDVGEFTNTGESLFKDKSVFEETITGTAANFSGTVTAPEFKGTAYRARLGDIAEKYLVDIKDFNKFPIGTVVEVADNINYEVQLSNLNSNKVIGVISENPAIILSDDLINSVTVALLGKVPVRVIDSINKGDRIVSYSDGLAISSKHIINIDSNLNYIGIALETNLDNKEKLVNCLIK